MSGLSWSAPEKRLGRACRMWPSGALAYPLDLRAEEIRIEDIAHHLSLTNRYGGGTPVPYSVAEHSVRAAKMNERFLDYQHLHAAILLHDAWEAYFTDVKAPLKDQVFIGGTDHHVGWTAYRPIAEHEMEMLRRIFAALGVDWPQEREWEWIHGGDEEIRRQEIAEFFEPEIGERRKSTRIKPLEWSYAERAFLAAWRRYGAS